MGPAVRVFKHLVSPEHGGGALSIFAFRAKPFLFYLFHHLMGPGGTNNRQLDNRQLENSLWGEKEIRLHVERKEEEEEGGERPALL